MRFVVGDIHGEFDKLRQLLSLLERQGAREVTFVGDYIDKGPKSEEVISCLLGFQKLKQCHFLKGNHEQQLIKALNGDIGAIEFLKKYGFKETLESYSKQKYSQNEFEEKMDSDFVRYIPESHISFLMNLSNYQVYSDFFIVHAGLGVKSNSEFDINDENSFYFARENFINTKKLFEGKKIIFGHTAFTEPFYDGFKLGIDTGAVYGNFEGYGKLSAINLDTFEIINNTGEKFSPKMNLSKNITLNRKVKVSNGY